MFLFKKVDEYSYYLCNFVIIDLLICMIITELID